MKKCLLLIALCSLVSCPLWAMNNNAEQQELARRERQSKATANLIWALVFTGGSFVAHHHFDHFIASLQGLPRLLGNIAWLGTATLTTLVTMSAADTFAQTMNRDIIGILLGTLSISITSAFIPAILCVQKRLISENVSLEYYLYKNPATFEKMSKLLGGIILPALSSDVLFFKYVKNM